MCYDDSRVGGGTLEDVFVRRGGQTNFASANEVNGGLPFFQATKDTLIKVMIGQETNHGFKPCALARASSSPFVGPGR